MNPYPLVVLNWLRKCPLVFSTWLHPTQELCETSQIPAGSSGLLQQMPSKTVLPFTLPLVDPIPCLLNVCPSHHWMNSSLESETECSNTWQIPWLNTVHTNPSSSFMGSIWFKRLLGIQKTPSMIGTQIRNHFCTGVTQIGLKIAPSFLLTGASLHLRLSLARTVPIMHILVTFNFRSLEKHVFLQLYQFVAIHVMVWGLMFRFK